MTGHHMMRPVLTHVHAGPRMPRPTRLTTAGWRAALVVTTMLAAGVGASAPRGQSLDPALIASIDQMFARWDSPASPGFAVGVVRNGRLIFAKGYGMAHLEHAVPLAADSPFYIASMSKQFTAACALLLADQGRLNLDDPVARYVPELRATGPASRPLTIRDLIHHTGGVREWSSLALFAGQDDRFEQRLNNADLLRMLARQTSLEFVPGSRYRYSSGGYLVLTIVIERVSGRPLPEFADEAFFRPLGMTGTVFEDNYAAIVPGRVESYRPVGGGRYERILKHFDVYGDGGMITTLADLARWDVALRTDRVGTPGLAQRLLTRGRLDDGTDVDYAFGLNVYTYRGHRVVEHGGGMLGFTVDMARFPDDDLTVIALANTPEVSSTAMAFRVADLLLGNDTPATAPAEIPNEVVAADLEGYVGTYWSAEGNFYRRVFVRGDRLHLDAGEGTSASSLIPVAPHTFAFADRPTRRAVFNDVHLPAARLRVGSPKTGDGYEAERYDPTPPTALAELRPFLGDYRSDELATTYRFREEDGKVVLQIGDGRPIIVFPTSGGRVVWNTKDMVWIGFGEVIFRRDATGAVNGLTIGDSRVSQILLRKAPPN